MRNVLLVLSLLLAGCQSAPPKVVLKEVKVAIPVECREPVPDRPVMPTESLQRGVSISTFVKAAQAEIERREGYEGQLRTALQNCRRSIQK